MKVWLTKLALVLLCSCSVGFTVTRDATTVTVVCKSVGDMVIASTKPITAFEPKTCVLEPTRANGKDTLLICPTPTTAKLLTAGTVSAQAFSPTGFPLTPPVIR